MKQINCFKCKHFFTTWNKQHPRGCKAYGFKTKEIPSLYVSKVSGEPCQHFSPNQKPQTNSKNKSDSYMDLNI